MKSSFSHCDWQVKYSSHMHISLFSLSFNKHRASILLDCSIERSHVFPVLQSHFHFPVFSLIKPPWAQLFLYKKKRKGKRAQPSPIAIHGREEEMSCSTVKNDVFISFHCQQLFFFYFHFFTSVCIPFFLAFSLNRQKRERESKEKRRRKKKLKVELN